jgi:hypothetical protein
MCEHYAISRRFLDDLDLVCPSMNGGQLLQAFLQDLDLAAASACRDDRQQAITAAELASLESEFKKWRNLHLARLRKYLERLRRDDLDDPLLSPISLFGTIGFGRLEVAHTRALAWLLSDAVHGFGFRLLNALIAFLRPNEGIRRVRAETVKSEFVMGTGRIDIFAEGSWDQDARDVSWCMAIEAKIDADEGQEQLSQYDQWLNEQTVDRDVIRVFLSPDGRSSRTSSAEWFPLSFANLAGVFRKEILGLRDKPGYHFLRYYLTGVLRDVCRLPVPIEKDCSNPYLANDYLEKVLGPCKLEDGDG